MASYDGIVTKSGRGNSFSKIMNVIDLTERDQSPPRRGRKPKSKPEEKGSVHVIVTAQAHVSSFQRTIPASWVSAPIKELLVRCKHAINIDMQLIEARENWPYYKNQPIYNFQERMDILGWLESIGYTRDEGYPETITKYPAFPLPPGVKDLEHYHQRHPAWQEVTGPVTILNFMSEDNGGGDSDDE